MNAKSPVKWLYQLKHSPTVGQLDGLTAHFKYLQEADAVLFCPGMRGPLPAL